jgi:hypothetical protein
MSRPETKKKRKKFAKHESAIRKIINNWPPIGCKTPDDEYDCLVHHLLSVLNSGGKKKEVAVRIKQELEHHFGLRHVRKKEVSSTADKIWKWWKGEMVVK